MLAEQQPAAKRWLALEYDVKGRQFDAHLVYPEDVKADEDSTDRRQAALVKRYGEKPIIYPPMSDDFQELT